MKIYFDSPEEFQALSGMLMSSYRYWQKRRQEAQGKICMTLDDKGRPTTSHYSMDQISRELSHIDQMMDIVNNMPHQEYEYSEAAEDWVAQDVEGTYATWVEDDYEDEDDEVVEEVVEEEVVAEGPLHLNPRPNLQADMIEWMNREEYAKGRWNLGYKD